MTREKVTIVGKIDSKKIRKSNRVDNGGNRRLRIDLAAIKEALEMGEVAGML